MTNRLRQLVATLLLFFVTGVHAATSGISTAYFVDAEPAASLTQSPPVNAQYQTFTHFADLGFRKGVIWVRVVREQTTGAPDPEAHVIRVGPHQLREVDFFFRADNRWFLTRTGASRPMGEGGPCLDDFHCLTIPALTDTKDVTYIRIQTPTIFNVDVQILTRDELAYVSNARNRALTTAVTIASALLLVAGMFALSERTGIAYAFLAVQSSIFLSLTATSGLLAMWLPLLTPASWATVAYATIVMRSLGFAFLFSAMLTPYEPARAYLAAMRAVKWLGVIAIALIAIDMPGLALRLNMLLILAAAMFSVYGVLSLKTAPRNIRIVLVAGGVLLLLAIFLAISGTFDLGGSVESTQIRSTSDWKLSGLVVALFILWFVVTENKRLEIQRMAEAQRLQLLASEATLMESAAKDRGMLVDMLAHEIKNPLASARFAATAIRQQLKENPVLSDRLRPIFSSINKIDRLLNHVTTANKLSYGTDVEPTEMVNFSDLIYQAIEEFDEPSRFKTQLDTRISREVNRQWLSIILENIMRNALTYATPNSDVVISLALLGASEEEEKRQAFPHGQSPRQSASVTLRVSNQVAPENKPDIAAMFTPYYRHPTSTGQPGLGLGLSIVQMATEKMGGFVESWLEDHTVIIEVNFP